MKYIMKKIRGNIGIVIVIIGIGIIGATALSRYYGETKQRKMMDSFEKSIVTYKQNEISEAKPIIKSPDSKPPKEDLGVIGLIIIPKIELKVTIGEGVDMNTLKYAVGHFPQTAMAGEKGNFCIAGHRSYTYSEYFNRLDEINKGDEIYIKTKQKEFKYVVYDKKIVAPSEYSVLDQTKDATLTLVTCTPIRVATHRLIIKARLQ